MDTLTKLLEMRMVASRYSLRFSNRCILRSLGWFSSSMSLMSEGESEKKAISLADTKPEQASRTRLRASAT